MDGKALRIAALSGNARSSKREILVAYNNQAAVVEFSLRGAGYLG